MNTLMSEQMTTPPVASPLDAEVDLEVLRLVPKQFAVVNEATANWVIRRIQSARTYAAHVEAWGQQELRRAEREEQTLFFLFGRQLEAWAKAEIEKLNGKGKSLNLPAGRIGFRKINSKLVIDDEKAVLAWCKSELPDAITVVERIAKTLIDEYAAKTGVIPDEGVHVEPEAEKFYVK